MDNKTRGRTGGLVLVTKLKGLLYDSTQRGRRGFFIGGELRTKGEIQREKEKGG